MVPALFWVLSAQKAIKAWSKIAVTHVFAPCFHNYYRHFLKTNYVVTSQ